MKNNKIFKTAVVAVLFVVLLVAAFAAGSVAGKKDNNYDSPTSDNSVSSDKSQQEDNRVSDSIFDLITAFDDYMDAAVQRAEVELELKFGALEIDEEFTVTSGIANDMPINHIQRGKLDIYICDGQVFVEDDDAHFNVNNSGLYDSFNMRQLFAIAYEIVQNSAFEVTAAGSETVYTVSLTQQQIENIFNAFQSTMEDYNIKIGKGVLKITFENGQLDELDIICTGYTEILSAQIDGGISVNADLSVSQQEITIPQAIIEQIK